MSEYHQNHAKDILQKIIYATVATVTPDGKPWNSPVRHCFDKELNIYWVSDKNGQHSKNVRHNRRAFIVIYDSTVPEGDGEGVYFETEVSEVTDPKEILNVRRIKKGLDYLGREDELLGGDVRRMYKAKPLRAWVNADESENGVFIRDYRVEIDIKKLHNLVCP